jgi:glucosyl-3-phosphoglycerate synthase
LKPRTFHHSDFSPATLASAKRECGAVVSVCLPARECAGTVGQIVAELEALRRGGLIDELVVVDAASADGTAAEAGAAGAEVWQEEELMPSLGPVLGKGDAMWRALARLRGEIVCFLDADTREFSARFASGLLGPLLCAPGIRFVKAFYRRPLGDAGDGGGRVNHLVARPALELFYPQLAGIRQPLAGEVAACRELLEAIAFSTGYGVEIAMLIDVWREAGLEAIAQVDLDEHLNRHQPLEALTPMARTVLATLAARLRAEGRLADGELDGNAPLERPPLAVARARGA